MNKQNLWFITLFSLILILGVYYVLIPNNLLVNEDVKESGDLVSVVVKESEIISALRITKEEERLSLESDYKDILTNVESTTDEKNNALEMIKSLNEVSILEEKLEKNINL